MKKSTYLYGINTVNTLVQHEPERILKLIIVQGRHDKRLEEIIHHAGRHNIHVETYQRHTIEKLMGAVNHQGVLAECRVKKLLTEDDLDSLLISLDHPAFLLILDGVQDPHNLGACLRSADATQIDAVIIPKDNAVSLTPTVEKVASGAATSVPLIHVTNLVRTLKSLKEHRLWVFGFSEEATEYYYQANFTGPVALVFGSEGKGIRKLTREHCDGLYSIPMLGTVSSLNVSVAASICLYEAVRQRKML